LIDKRFFPLFSENVPKRAPKVKKPFTVSTGLENCFHSYSSCKASDLKIHLPCSKTYLPCIFVWLCLLPSDKWGRNAVLSASCI